MSNLHAEILRDQAVGDGLDGVFAGMIAETAGALTTKVPVILDVFDPGLQFGPCSWMPRVKTVTVNVAEAPESAHNVDVAQVVMPSRGDRCRVAFDDSDSPVIVWWEPA